MKINCKQIIKNLKGEDMQMGSKEDGDLRDLTVGEMLGEILNSSEVGGAHKLYILASKFVNQDEVELDNADVSLVRKSLEKSPIKNNMVIGFLLDLLENTGAK